MAKATKRPDTHGPRKQLADDRALYREAISARRLEDGWRRVWENGGAAGGDRESVLDFSRLAVQQLRRLRAELAEGEYAPRAIRPVDIPKRSGRGMRRLMIPAVRDRVVQTAVAMTVTPVLDAEFEPLSFGYRQGKSVQQAVAQISRAQREGFGWVVDADIEDFFGSIEHGRLMERWGESVSPGPLTELVSTWITHAAPMGRGVAQGSPLSPVLANLYLDRLDELFWGAGARLIRFADDFVVLCRSEGGAARAKKKVARLLGEYGLRMNEAKTQITEFDKGFRFLGHLFVRSMAMKAAPGRMEEVRVAALMRQVAEDDQRAAAEAETARLETEAKEAAGYSPGLRVLYVHSADRRLGVRNQAITVEGYDRFGEEDGRWRELIAIPHQDVDRIELGSDVAVDRATIDHLLGTDTPAALVDGYGQTQGWISKDLAPRAGRHLAQAALFLDGEKRVGLARILVLGRLRNQRAVLRRLLAGRRHPPAPVTRALVSLNRLIGRQEKGPLYGADTVEKLLGHEGVAGSAWWDATRALLPEEMRFERRERPGARDPANICFNVLSSLMERDVAVAVSRAGLHPGFGVLHSVRDRNEACVFDLMEEFRAHLIGGLVVYCANRRIVRPEMFEPLDGGVRMVPAGMRALIRAYEARVDNKVTSPAHGKRVTWRRLMVEQGFALARHFEGDGVYRPYEMDY